MEAAHAPDVPQASRQGPGSERTRTVTGATTSTRGGPASRPASPGPHSAHDSLHGRIESPWRIAGDMFRLTTTVPPAMTAEIVLRDGTLAPVGPGTN